MYLLLTKHTGENVAGVVYGQTWCARAEAGCAACPGAGGPAAPGLFWDGRVCNAGARARAQTRRQAVALALQESFWREWQVLPARTHPAMSMSATGGYLLSGIQVALE